MPIDSVCFRKSSTDFNEVNLVKEYVIIVNCVDFSGKMDFSFKLKHEDSRRPNGKPCGLLISSRLFSDC